MELEGQLEQFRKRGIGVASVVHEPPATLKGFAEQKGITFPLLADPDSVVIRRFGLLDPSYPRGHENHGVPSPVTFVTDAQGIVREKYYEDRVGHRRTAGSILVLEGEPGAGAQEVKTDHFTLRTSVSNSEVAPGQRFTFVLEFEMQKGHHAYAPGAQGYRPLVPRLDHPQLQFHEVRYPPARSYYFAPLKETVPVFEGAFRIMQDATVVIEKVPNVKQDTTLPFEITGVLEYQVCSDRVCYAPGTLPLRFSIRLRPWVK